MYRVAYALAMRVFELSKWFTAEERYALTGQIRRASRSVCLNLREAWVKRRYEAHFTSKLTDGDGEAEEPDSCLDFAHDSQCLTAAEHQETTDQARSVGRMLGFMIKHPGPFLITDR